MTNAFALLGLRALYFVLEGALGKLRHVGILAVTVATSLLAEEAGGGVSPDRRPAASDRRR